MLGIAYIYTALHSDVVLFCFLFRRPEVDSGFWTYKLIKESLANDTLRKWQKIGNIISRDFCTPTTSKKNVNQRETMLLGSSQIYHTPVLY